MKQRVAQVFVHKSILVLIILGSVVRLSSSIEEDTISGGVVIKDPETIVSEKQIYKLGFFTPPNTTNRYVGVFFAFSEETVIWVANREKPLKDASGAVTLSQDGNLVVIDGANQTLWSTNLTTSSVNSTVQILDTGNLVVRDAATGDTLWQSFSEPTNVVVPGMTLSQNVKTGKQVAVSAWKNASDPEIGSFSAGLDALSIPQLFAWNEGRPHWRSGPWNGLIFLGIKEMFYAYLDGFTQVKNDSAGNFFYTKPQENVYITASVNSSGSVIRKVWNGIEKRWDLVWTAPENECDVYGKCGPFGSCNALQSPICTCLRGFEPVNEDEWRRGNWTNGCGRRNQLQCGKGDRFQRLQYMKVPDFAQPLPSRVQDECRTTCMANCSCLAYAYDLNIGCMFWSNILIDAQEFDRVGVDLYIRLSASEFDSHKGRKFYIIIPVAVGFVCISTMIFIAWWFMVKKKGDKAKDTSILEAGHMFTTDSTAMVLRNESKEVNIGELPKFTFEMLANATNQFHEDNLLGRGGFGPVYKGVLANGKDIAVKRLSTDSGQGVHEFMNEVIVISKLQHRNLVKLLGGCVDKEEKILIYEYMPNKSLDACIFGPTNPTKKLLDWKMRYNIIEGIGRGILYLHRDSRLRIIHRDLKPSNVLLDQDWNPKISDFGMARIFGGNEDHGSTARVVGTYGYMAPEYAMEGRFSEKSDVYSFGVLILEIIKGKKNTHYFNDEWSLSLIGYAWKMWSEGNGLSFVEESIVNRESEEEMIRCIQIGLLCVQESPNNRPTIQIALSMLSREIVELPVPKQPVFAENGSTPSDGSTHQNGYSNNDLTLTVLDGR
ncbi:G-type lectin S-receptor-like serine/threonine-protein kinase At1g11300 [Salvia miltiorrhiza]|uniref:G-type lectin S-receptor-like serine/threonine-protein kinase At1g11300 n=1 Tax=Salvia miltiorrhiza TaxID=226208 RepID=UPI0025AB5FF4|nr:G-type lectin S-receptor-like serine/threonine-protein kinase At1g11300 [Salvia miltiorrhiza]